jgi:uncharacterized membrane protein YeaQ/YmgE (transglycosylase-associated protein family)
MLILWWIIDGLIAGWIIGKIMKGSVTAPLWISFSVGFSDSRAKGV